LTGSRTVPLGCLLALLALVPALASAQRTAPLRIVVAHPAPGATIDVGDSLFLFGSLSDPAAHLTVAGHQVPVFPDGGWLAWIPIPRDSLVTVELVASLGSSAVRRTVQVTRAHYIPSRGAWVDRSTLAPMGQVILPVGEPLPLTVRAAPGSKVRLRWPDGQTVSFQADSLPDPVADGIRAFDRDDRNLVRPIGGDRYVAVLRDATPRGADTLLAPSEPPADTAVLEAVHDGDTARVLWPLSVTRTAAPVAVILDGDPLHGGAVDPVTAGRNQPTGPYAWFFNPSTRARVDMQRDDAVRLRLTDNMIAWIPRRTAVRAPIDDPRPAVIGALTVARTATGAQLRVPLSAPAPFRVVEHEAGLDIEFFDAVAAANWTRYGAGQAIVREVTWQQQATRRAVISIQLTRSLWGWRSHFDHGDLVIELREPPAIDSLHPLVGRTVVIDAGHPPGGACGPTAYCEPEANLAVAMLVRDSLIALGARVVLTRSTADSLGLWPRTARADSENADLFVSIHHNGLPDGINPFANSGTSTFYNHGPSLPFAVAMQQALVAAIGLPDLGVTRGDLAVTRATWYPAILTEGYSLDLPDQEIAARSPAGQQRYANGIVAGISAWLRDVARQSTAPPR
jgi:N-acetylmuramoyl-L-alanine amidase